jgi:low affinity Fe/Cu permease
MNKHLTKDEVRQMLDKCRKEEPVREIFRRFAHKTAEIVGSPMAFLMAIILIVVWSLTGPLFHFSDTWQLVINTTTTIITFLIVFLIQNTQNRDCKAIHLKLDELLKGVRGARTSLVDLEDLTDAELERLHQEFQRLRRKTNHHHKEQKTGRSE